MKNVLGLLIALSLALLACVLNWKYLERKSQEIETVAFLAVGDDVPGQETQLYDRRRLQALDRALAALPDALKAPLLRATLEARPHSEIANILGISPKAVETRIARARRFLAARLDPPQTP